MFKKLFKKRKGLIAFIVAFAFIFTNLPVNAMETGKENVNANEAVNQSETTNDEAVIKGENGFQISAPSTPERLEVFPELKLEVTTPSNAEELENKVLNSIDPYGTAKAYELCINDLEQTEENMDLFSPNVNVTIPVPEGWDASRTIVVEIIGEAFGYGSSRFDSETNTMSAETNLFASKTTNQFVLLQVSVPTQVKNWDLVVKDYIHIMRYTNWGTGHDANELEPRFFESEASANDIALVTYYKNQMFKYNANSPYYDETKGIIRIPHDVLVNDAKKLFAKVPDMRKVDLTEYLVYDAETDSFVTTYSAGGFDLVTVVDEVHEISEGTYAIWFRVSHDANVSFPDMSDPSAYTKCTLTVQDNGEGDWKYLSFEEGYLEKEIEDRPENPDQPGNTLTEEKITAIVNEINKAEDGEDIVVSMENAKILPSDILSAAKGKNVNIILKMDGYTWTINGKNINASDLEDINMEVKYNVNAIPKDAIDELAKGKEVKQISLVHDGAFGFEAQLTLNVGEEYAGNSGDLYWYQNDAFKHIDSGNVDDNGEITFTMNHASDYVIVFDQSSDKGEATGPVEDTPDTGANMPVAAYMMMLCISSIGLIKLYKNGKRNLTK